MLVLEFRVYRILNSIFSGFQLQALLTLTEKGNMLLVSTLEKWCTQIQVQTVHYRYGVHRYRYRQYIRDMVYTDTGTDSTLEIWCTQIQVQTVH